MPKIQKSHRLNSVTFFIGLTVSFIFLNFLFIIFARNEAQTIGLLKQELRVLEQNERIISSSQDLYNRYENQIQAISDVFPNEETIPIFIQSLEEIIRKSSDEYSFKFGSVTPLKEQDKLFLPLTITMKTDFTRLLVFMESLEKLPFMTHILTISNKVPDEFNGTGEASLSVKVYVQNPFTNQ